MLSCSPFHPLDDHGHRRTARRYQKNHHHLSMQPVQRIRSMLLAAIPQLRKSHIHQNYYELLVCITALIGLRMICCRARPKGPGRLGRTQRAQPLGPGQKGRALWTLQQIVLKAIHAAMSNWNTQHSSNYMAIDYGATSWSGGYAVPILLACSALHEVPPVCKKQHASPCRPKKRLGHDI